MSKLIPILVVIATFGCLTTPVFAGDAELTETIRQQWQPFIAAMVKQYETWPAVSKPTSSPAPVNYFKTERAIKLMDAAVNAGAYDVALKYSTVLRMAGFVNVQDLEAYIALIRKLQAAPNDPANRLAFVQEYWNGRNRPLEIESGEARQFLIATDKLPLSPAERLQVYQRIIDRTIARCHCRYIEGELEFALKYVEKIQVSFPTDTSAIATAYFRVAKGYSYHKEPQVARELLERALALRPPPANEAILHLGLSEVCEILKDEEAMLKHLKLAAKSPPVETNRGLMDTYDTQQVAIVRLGKHYQERQDFPKALEYFTSWRPTSWCGTCLMQMNKEREASIKACEAEIKKSQNNSK